ncbi:hypothetical protein QR680_007412 [Steinernema hermaphroditum]|uniref:Uncharacterized protein n=1 Tax=Steinernema hermaphroditum TaxID=289476 RepID=A0AA39IEJ2_9BILA|nr:hypothetical protein QR680_007412 [Steinernema hermaphroditum]
MESYRTFIGFLHICVAVSFAPINLRILYVLLKNDLRKTECYRIMAQIQFFSFLNTQFFIMFGIMMISKSSLNGLVSSSASLLDATTNAVVIMDMILALNRLKVMFDWRIPQKVFLVLQWFTWLFATFDLILLLTPLAGYALSDDLSMVLPNIDLPFTAYVSYVDTCFNAICSLLSLSAYVVIVSYLIVKKCQSSLVQSTVSEIPILVQAVLRFVGDLTVQLLFQLLFITELETLDVLDQILALLLLINYVCLPPLSYIAINRNVRRAVFNIKTYPVFVSRHTLS